MIKLRNLNLLDPYCIMFVAQHDGVRVPQELPERILGGELIFSERLSGHSGVVAAALNGAVQQWDVVLTQVIHRQDPVPVDRMFGRQ